MAYPTVGIPCQRSMRFGTWAILLVWSPREKSRLAEGFINQVGNGLDKDNYINGLGSASDNRQTQLLEPSEAAIELEV